MQRIHYIQHVPFETPGSILNWTRTNSVPLSSTRLYDDEPFPETDMFDCLVVMGGPMGVYDGDRFSWLRNEKTFIEKAIKADKAVLGICLGAQLVADVLGSRITQNKYREIGWFPISTMPENKDVASTGFLPHTLTVLHWHGDTFELPSGARRIAASEGCANQGFAYGDRVVGLQFHLEVTEKSLQEMVKNGRHELVADRFVQDEHDILSNREFIRSNNAHMSTILDGLSNTP